MKNNQILILSTISKCDTQLDTSGRSNASLRFIVSNGRQMQFLFEVLLSAETVEPGASYTCLSQSVSQNARNVP